MTLSSPVSKKRIRELVPSQGPLKSTWHRHPDKHGWGVYHWMAHLLDLDPLPASSTATVPDPNDAIPVWDTATAHFYIWTRFLLAFGLQWLYTRYTQHNWSRGINLVYWATYTSLFGINVLHSTRRVAQKIGYLQPHRNRDGIPDHRVREVMQSLIFTALLRPAAATWFIYDPLASPSLSVWLPLLIPAFAIGVDFWFYWYHRAMHEIGWLWRFHKTHHLAKLPTPILTLYADSVQELFDILVIPILSYLTISMVLPFGYYDWMVCWSYVEVLELIGHSGIRCAGTSPAFDLLPLARLDMDIVVEDHDLHHSQGWKKSGNYGKQTRIFDQLFGTVLPRVETLNHLIDPSAKVAFPAY
ncbi:uncharacterized protein UMAG_05070 [Mycosarcoma maydis]|uniref:Fatty acid hydroxylase domain-containing protein n=1 Tax=Mycosarcoma maydis TaxID=5270 RepID=A0A0D1C9E3_MYCMD|nr:uncharacterized protein UMAG_05070 [Ustilago maydis 521]KIS69997.1 hypothetical protein UMAG_05070 [Ustilago maydis 521]|eukprot:XP_011388152.1 hypothetical protein UMAG_05070 [Ustilago maydis 521]